MDRKAKNNYKAPFMTEI